MRVSAPLLCKPTGRRGSPVLRRGLLPAESRWPSSEVRLQRRITLVNAAFLLVTTAWFAGADPAPAATAAPAAPLAAGVASTPLGGVGVGSGCCGGAGYGGAGYGGCCEQCCRMGFLARHRAKKCCNTGCECGNTGCGCGGGYGGGYAGGCGGGGYAGGCGGGYAGGCGGGANVAGGCCEPVCCCKPSLCQRLKARLHRNNCCCDNGNDGCCGGGYGAYGAGVGSVGGVGGVGGFGAPPAVMPNAEPIKKLPSEAPKKSGTVQSPNQGLTPTSSSNVLETNPF
jgi:hypothetical protein